MKLSGKCLCGSVSVAAELGEDTIGVCHCGMCRKWGGGPLFCTGMASNVKFTGEEFIGVYDSSDWAQRAFCKRCGTHLFYRMKSSGSYNFPVGLIDGTDNFKFNTEIFIDSKPPNYEFANPTRKLTEKQVLEMFAPPAN